MPAFKKDGNKSRKRNRNLVKENHYIKEKFQNNDLKKRFLI